MLRQIFKKTGIILFCVLLICTLLPANMSVDAFAAETEATAKIELRIDNKVNLMLKYGYIIYLK